MVILLFVVLSTSEYFVITLADSQNDTMNLVIKTVSFWGQMKIKEISLYWILIMYFLSTELLHCNKKIIRFTDTVNKMKQLDSHSKIDTVP
jgi:hypothetical protein